MSKLRHFALHPELAKVAGSKGGQRSSRAGIRNGHGANMLKKLKKEVKNVKKNEKRNHANKVEKILPEESES